MLQSQFKHLAQAFLNTVEQDITSAQLDLDKHWDVDHVCYRVGTFERYKYMQEFLSTFSNLLGESEVNGRPISTFKLSEPFVVAEREIYLVELPAPKSGVKNEEGFEHIEVVVDVSFSELKKRFKQFEQKTSGLSKDFNQELAIKINDYTVKFHQISLQSVIELENNKKVHSAILKSQVLSLLKKFKPLVVGTFPLAIATLKSDVDIILNASDLNELKQSLENQFSNYDSFVINRSQGTDTDHILASFIVDEVQFELYGQNLETVKQRAFRHFQIEERLLKYGGDNFKNKIMKLRNEGLKTEPAFAKALNLAGDPFIQLLKLQKSSHKQIHRALHS